MNILEQQAEDRMSTEKEILYLLSMLSEDEKDLAIAMTKQLLAERNAKP